MTCLGNYRIIKNIEVSPLVYTMEVLSPELSSKAAPGQFAMLRVGDTSDPLLRRPLSFHGSQRDSGIVSFLYHAKGKGTEKLSRIKTGELISIQGPLGKGFDTDINNKEVLLVAGGIGFAPMPFLYESLVNNNSVTLLMGAVNVYGLKILESFPEYNTIVSTDDGSAGNKGSVADLLWKCLEENNRPFRVYSCGPTPMLSAISKICKYHSIECQISLESKMACGVGACLGCACYGKEKYLKICTEGPVFWSREVEFND